MLNLRCMNLGLHIFNLLQEKGIALVPGFGEFFLEKKSAQYDEAQSSMLPPGQEIVFVHNTELFGTDLAIYISGQTSEPLSEIQERLKQEAASWNRQLNENNRLSIENLAEITLENGSTVLKPYNGINQNPSFYGLETINLKELNPQIIETEEHSYVFNRSLLWTFLFILPVGGLIYLAISNQELLFGKKSLQLSVTTSTQRIQEKKLEPVKRDPLQTQDSLKTEKPIYEKK